jgi:tetratricopeptide (TPR) repeat protein
MSTNRTEILKTMLAQNPADAFARYGLAMELVKGGELENAIIEFRTLLDHNPNYAAAYFHGGQALEKLGDVEQARALYEKGVEVTSRTGDQHTRSELQAALDMLPI